LLSFRSSLLKFKPAAPAPLNLCKSDIDQATKHASLPEVKASLRILRVYLDKRVPPTSAVAPAPSEDSAPISPSTAPATPEFSATTPLLVSAAITGATSSCAELPVKDDVEILADLAATVSRLSVVMLHLLSSLPLSALSSETFSTEGQMSDAQTRRGGGLGLEGERGGLGGHETFRGLLGVGMQLMLYEHKQHLISKLMANNMPRVRVSRSPRITIDRFGHTHTHTHTNTHTHTHIHIQTQIHSHTHTHTHIHTHTRTHTRMCLLS